MVLEFLNELTQAGYRIFSTSEAQKIAQEMGVDHSLVPYILRTLSAKNLIKKLLRGLYALEDHLLSGPPLHKFEIAMHLAKDGAICCWSAMSYYDLTDQVLSTVFVLAPYDKSRRRPMYRYKIEGYEYMLIQTERDHFWGIERQSLGEIKIMITDLERTLIDGLIRSHYCGGFREVLNAFSIARDQIDQKKIIEYGNRCTVSVRKRLGWVLTHLSLENLASQLEISETNHFDKLDVSLPRRGKKNTQWMVWENF